MSGAPYDLAGVESRTTAVEAVHQVMRAVWALARAQLPQAEQAAAQASVWLDQVEGIVERLVGPPLPGDDADTLWVVVGPDRPLCGSLAQAVVRGIPADGAVGLVGTRLHELADGLPGLAGRLAFALPGAAGADELGATAERVAEAILTAARKRVVLVYPSDARGSLREVVLLTTARAPVRVPPETFSPFDAVVEAAVHEAVTGRLDVVLAETLRAEIRARLQATDAARQAADAELDELQHVARVLRQGQITDELLEIVGALASR